MPVVMQQIKVYRGGDNPKVAHAQIRKQMHNKEAPLRGGASVDTSRLKQLHSSQEVETKMHWMNLHC